MSLGLGIVLFVIGAILAFALNLAVDWINLQLVGYILMIAGAVVIILGIVLLARRAARSPPPTRSSTPPRASRVTRNESSLPEDPTVLTARPTAAPRGAPSLRGGALIGDAPGRVAMPHDRGRDHERHADERGHHDSAVEGVGGGCRELVGRSDAGRPSATVTAPASVSRAASASAAVRIAGSSIADRYYAARMLPSTAVPSTAPSS